MVEKKIIKKTLSEQIYTILKDDILSRKLTFGEKVVNRDLQQRFGVSSSPIRDAINKLYSDGLVEEVSNTGAKIISFDIRFAKEINEFICIISSSALELSSKKNKEHAELVETLFKILDLQYTAKDENEYFFYDYKFHKVFFDYSGNNFLKETYTKYNVLGSMLTKYAYEQTSGKKTSLIQHQEIAAAYNDKNFTLAKNLMIEHYNSGIVRLSSVLKEPIL